MYILPQILHTRTNVITNILYKTVRSSIQDQIYFYKYTKLNNIFSSTRKLRKEIIKAGQETDKPNFGRK